jgi:two-component system, OmpR family, alkaline phosphatase synthesis response regulator PhoP
VPVVSTTRSTSARVAPGRRELRRRRAEVRLRRDEPLHSPTAARATSGGRAPAEAQRVMIVDDEASIRLICSINFTASGWEAIEATDGEEALERIPAEKPDVVLLDVMMPRADGWTVAERLAADPATRDVPVVFLSARAEQRDRERAHALGAVAYLTKPIDPVRLPDLVEEILGRLERGERDALRAELLDESRYLR